MKALIFTLCLAAFLCCKTDKPLETKDLANAQISTSVPNEDENIPGTWEPAGDDGLVYHYVCPDRCNGGVLDAPGTCPVCGKDMYHNSAYHFNNNNPTETPAADRNFNTIRSTENDPPKSVSGFWHFICPNGHEGSGESGKCAECGTDFLHNSSYHIDEDSKDDPPQNESGDWHFICQDGHKGGAGAPLNCEVCDKVLVHNDAYHH